MIQHCKIRKNRKPQEKVEECYYSFLLIRKSKQPSSIYLYQFLSSFFYLSLATDTFSYTIFGILPQKLTTNKGQKLYQFLQENGVTALQTIC